FQVGRGGRCGARTWRLFADDAAPLFESGNAGGGPSILADCPYSRRVTGSAGFSGQTVRKMTILDPSLVEPFHAGTKPTKQPLTSCARTQICLVMSKFDIQRHSSSRENRSVG